MEPIWASPGLSLAPAPAIAGEKGRKEDFAGSSIELEEANLG
jgi:hypothetical protein